MKTSFISYNWLLYAALMTPFGALANDSLITPEQISESRCFEFPVESPQRDFHFEPQTTTACYLQIDERRQLAFLKDSEGANLFTSVLTTTTEEGVQLEHFSQVMGEATRAKQNVFAHNPLPAPHTLEAALNSTPAPQEISQFSIYSDELREQLNAIYKSFYDKSIKTVEVDEDFGALHGEALTIDSSYLSRDRQPSDGYWWPHTGVPLADGPSSPLAKYDAYVESVTGKNPRSFEWEKANHHTDTFWAGHCNGWAAASILYGFDDMSLRDSKNSTIITASDLQGLRTATSYCVSTKVIGKRYSGPGSDVTDVHADVFHKTLQYYIRLMKKPVVIDYLSMMPVDNHIISGYTMNYERAGTNRYLVTAKLRVHGYNYGRVNVKQVAKHYELVYKYYLWKDDRGRILGGRWVDPKDHPDFMWVPLSQSRCRGENPRVDHSYVEHMIKNLKRVTNHRW